MMAATTKITINRSVDSIEIYLQRLLDEDLTQVLVSIDGYPADGPTATHCESREALNLTLDKLDRQYRCAVESIEISHEDEEVLSNDDVVEILKISGFESVKTFFT